MKPSISAVVSWLILGVLAQSPQSVATAHELQWNASPTNEQPTPSTRLALSARPQVRADLLMVSVPQESALRLLPALRDPDRVSAAHDSLLKLVAQKKATLIDWPEVTVHSGDRAVSETILEQRYPSEFDQPTEPAFSIPKKQRTAEEQALRFLRLSGLLIPVTFESRNTGVSFEAGATVSDDGNSAALQLSTQFVRLERMKQFPTTTAETGKPASVEQPVFQTRKVSLSLSLRDGEHRLIYVGKVTEPSENIELFILCIRIVPTLAPAK